MKDKEPLYRKENTRTRMGRHDHYTGPDAKKREEYTRPTCPECNSDEFDTCTCAICGFDVFAEAEARRIDDALCNANSSEEEDAILESCLNEDSFDDISQSIDDHYSEDNHIPMHERSEFNGFPDLN